MHNSGSPSNHLLQGSGKSGGEYVTLGAHEVDDLGMAVAHLRGRFSSCTIGLWGRSMGAVTALLYSQRDPSIAGIVRACLPASDLPCQCLPCMPVIAMPDQDKS